MAVLSLLVLKIVPCAIESCTVTEKHQLLKYRKQKLSSVSLEMETYSAPLSKPGKSSCNFNGIWIYFDK
jgi:hypothetical protein